MCRQLSSRDRSFSPRRASAAAAAAAAAQELLRAASRTVADVVTRLEIKTDLHHSLSRDQLLLHFQPIVSLGASRVHCLETLLRWQHPVRGLVSPADFIAIAEETGLIVRIGMWVLRQSRLQLAAWQTAFPCHRNLQVAVNLSPVQFRQRDLVRDVRATILPMAQKNGSAIGLRIDDGLGSMFADMTRVRQCFFNLLSNACKFTRNGVVNLVVRRESVRHRDELVVEVHDTGIGMDPAQLGRLFQAFSQADASTTRKYGGAGLGFVITRKICETMGGRVTACSDLGEGSVFTLRLPFIVRDPGLAAPADGVAAN